MVCDSLLATSTSYDNHRSLTRFPDNYAIRAQMYLDGVEALLRMTNGTIFKQIPKVCMYLNNTILQLTKINSNLLKSLGVGYDQDINSQYELNARCLSRAKHKLSFIYEDFNS